MQNEIELKIMLDPANVMPLSNWLAQQNVLENKKDLLGNIYFDTPEQFFAQRQMGFRVRSKNNQYEMTLKMKGDTLGGLHIRPEYNLALESNIPDFKRLNSHFNLQIAEADYISENLQATFSTDFSRHKWLLRFNQSTIEAALDQGVVKNRFGEEAICELEFELLDGNLADILALLEAMPKYDGMWLSNLSKAQRGYFTAQPERFKSELNQILSENRSSYFLEQQFTDYLRSFNDQQMAEIFYTQFPQFRQIEMSELAAYLKSKVYFTENLMRLKQMLADKK